MKTLQRGMLIVACISLFAAGTAAQFMRQGPPAMRGVWKPVVGSGGAYKTDMKRDKQEMEITIVGTESVEGKTGYWQEIFMKTEEGDMVMKQLMVFEGDMPGPRRMIMQPPGMDPMEMPMQGMMGRRPEKLSGDVRQEAQKVGTETITTPAGTFECEHWRSNDGSTDVWLSEKVSPWGMVQMKSKDGTMTLTRVISGAKSRITKTPTKFDPMEMMKRERP